MKIFRRNKYLNTQYTTVKGKHYEIKDIYVFDNETSETIVKNSRLQKNSFNVPDSIEIDATVNRRLKHNFKDEAFIIKDKEPLFQDDNVYNLYINNDTLKMKPIEISAVDQHSSFTEPYITVTYKGIKDIEMIDTIFLKSDDIKVMRNNHRKIKEITNNIEYEASNLKHDKVIKMLEEIKKLTSNQKNLQKEIKKKFDQFVIETKKELKI